MELTISNRNRKIKVTLLAALIGFGASFLVTPFILNHVYGLPNTYNQVLEITKNATNNTEGHMIDNYVENVKEDICKTLVNSTEFEECMKL